MSIRADRLMQLPENVQNLSVIRRGWNGIHVDVGEFACAGEVVHHLSFEAEIRLSAILEEIGSPCEPRLRKDLPCPIGYTPRHMSFAPAGMEIWGYSANSRYVKDATLIFDLGVLRERLATNLNDSATTTPRLRFSDDRIWPLVKLFAEVVNDPHPSTPLYGDGLIAAITARLFGESPKAEESEKGLSPSQLRRVIEYLVAHLPKHIELADLARLAGLGLADTTSLFRRYRGAGSDFETIQRTAPPCRKPRCRVKGARRR